MSSQPASPRRTFITPLSGRELLDPGQVFPREELVRRVLSLFWRNCCGVPGLARAPAPVLELSGYSASGARHRARAWWVLYDGIVEETEGPEAERLALFFGSNEEEGVLWPCYDFEVVEKPFAVEMNFHQEAGLHWSSRVRLELLADGSVHVVGRGALYDP